MVWPENLPKIDEKTKIIVNAHGKPASDVMTSDTGKRMSAAELAKIIAENVKPGTAQVRISVEICSGGTGKSVESHDESFAAHLALELCALGIENSVISAGLGIMYVSAQGRTQITALDFERRQAWLAVNENVFLGADKNTYLSLFEFSPSRGKSPGSKVILIFNKERGFTQDYPYGQCQKDEEKEESEAAIQAERNYRNAHKAYNAIKDKAIKALDSILAEMSILPSYKKLFENKLFLDLMSKLKKDLEQYEMYDAKTISNYIDDVIGSFKKGAEKEGLEGDYRLLLFRFKNDFKKKVNQTPQLKFYLDLQEKLSGKCRSAISKIEAHIFDIDKKRLIDLIRTGSSDLSYDKNFIEACHQNILKEIDDRKVLKNLFAIARVKDELDWVSIALIYKAIKADDLDELKLLLESGANIHAKDSMGHTPLQLAVEKGNHDIEAFLRKNGANEGLADVPSQQQDKEFANANSNSDNPFIFLQRSSSKSTQTIPSNSTQLRPQLGQ